MNSTNFPGRSLAPLLSLSSIAATLADWKSLKVFELGCIWHLSLIIIIRGGTAPPTSFELAVPASSLSAYLLCFFVSIDSKAVAYLVIHAGHDLVSLCYDVSGTGRCMHAMYSYLAYASPRARSRVASSDPLVVIRLWSSGWDQLTVFTIQYVPKSQNTPRDLWKSIVCTLLPSLRA